MSKLVSYLYFFLFFCSKLLAFNKPSGDQDLDLGGLIAGMLVSVCLEVRTRTGRTCTREAVQSLAIN